MGRNRIDTREEKIGQPQAFDLPAFDPISREDIADEIEIMDTPRAKTKAAELAFLNEMVDIELLPSANPNDKQIEYIWNGGVAQALFRGKRQSVKRMFVEVLARCKRNMVSTQEYIDSTGARATRVVKTPSLLLPFTIHRDPNPNGSAWLQRILAEI